MWIVQNSQFLQQNKLVELRRRTESREPELLAGDLSFHRLEVVTADHPPHASVAHHQSIFNF